MAFQLITKPRPIPPSLEGIYILPYSWFEYGLTHGHLSVIDLAFYDTVQGSMYALAKQAKLPTVYDFGNGPCDIWLSYEPGTKKVNVIADLQRTEEGKWMYSTIESHYGEDIEYIATEFILSQSMQIQKEYNRSYIQLLKGCKVNLVHSVWKVNL